MKIENHSRLRLWFLLIFNINQLMAIDFYWLLLMLLIIDFDWLVSSGIFVCFSSSAILRLLSNQVWGDVIHSFPYCNGWFQKISIPYHGWHEYFNPPLPSEIPKCLSPPCPPNSKITNPSSPPEFSTFVSDPLEFLFVCLNLQTNEKLALFPSAKEFCSQFLVRRSSNSSLLTLVHRSYSF